ncbi:MAG: hypothetical protein R6T90_07425 [Dissulfuribacterales bacterium]
MAEARREHDRALQKAVIEKLSDHTEQFKQFSGNPGFNKWFSDAIFGVTCEKRWPDAHIIKNGLNLESCYKIDEP